MTGTASAQHWDDVYAAKAADETSWFQRSYDTSMRLIAAADPTHGPLVDIGGGVGTLVDELVDDGWRDVTVLDISAEAMRIVRERLAGRTDVRITTIASDVLDWRPGRAYAVWHDRAVLHFLTDDADRAAYARLAADAVMPGGALVIGCFAPDGPEACSGLPVRRASAQELADLFTDHFALEASEQEEHVTPWGAVQAFTWVTLRHRADA